MHNTLCMIYVIKSCIQSRAALDAFCHVTLYRKNTCVSLVLDAEKNIGYIRFVQVAYGSKYLYVMLQPDPSRIICIKKYML